MDKPRPSPTSIYLRPEIRAALSAAATAEGRSVSNLVQKVLTEWLRAHGHLKG